MKNQIGLMLCLSLLVPNAAVALADEPTWDNIQERMEALVKKATEIEKKVEEERAAQRKEQADIEELAKKIFPLMVERCDLNKGKQEYLAGGVGLERSGKLKFEIVRSVTVKGEAWIQAEVYKLRISNDESVLAKQAAYVRLLENGIAQDKILTGEEPAESMTGFLNSQKDAVERMKEALRHLKIKLAAFNMIVQQDGGSTIIEGKDYARVQR